MPKLICSMALFLLIASSSGWRSKRQNNDASNSMPKLRPEQQTSTILNAFPRDVRTHVQNFATAQIAPIAISNSHKRNSRLKAEEQKIENSLVQFTNKYRRSKKSNAMCECQVYYQHTTLIPCTQTIKIAKISVGYITLINVPLRIS